MYVMCAVPVADDRVVVADVIAIREGFLVLHVLFGVDDFDGLVGFGFLPLAAVVHDARYEHGTRVTFFQAICPCSVLVGGDLLVAFLQDGNLQDDLVPAVLFRVLPIARDAAFRTLLHDRLAAGMGYDPALSRSGVHQERIELVVAHEAVAFPRHLRDEPFLAVRIGLGSGELHFHVLRNVRGVSLGRQEELGLQGGLRQQVGLGRQSGLLLCRLNHDEVACREAARVGRLG